MIGGGVILLLLPLFAVVLIDELLISDGLLISDELLMSELVELIVPD